MSKYKVDPGVQLFKTLIQEEEDLFKIAANDMIERMKFQ